MSEKIYNCFTELTIKISFYGLLAPWIVPMRYGKFTERRKYYIANKLKLVSWKELNFNRKLSICRGLIFNVDDTNTLLGKTR